MLRDALGMLRKATGKMARLVGTHKHSHDSFKEHNTHRHMHTHSHTTAFHTHLGVSPGTSKHLACLVKGLG